MAKLIIGSTREDTIASLAAVVESAMQDAAAYRYPVIDVFCGLASVAIAIAKKHGVRREAIGRAFGDLLEQAFK